MERKTNLRLAIVAALAGMNLVGAKVPASRYVPRSVPRSGSPEVRDWNAAVELGETPAQIRARFGYPRP